MPARRNTIVMSDAEVAREPERVEARGLTLFERYAGKLSPEIRTVTY